MSGALHRQAAWGARALLWAVVAAVAPWPSGARAGVEVTPGLRIGLEERYDDNALLAQAGAGQLMTKLTPQAGLDARGRTFEAGGWYAADLSLRHGSGSFSVDHRGKLKLLARFSERAWVDGALSAWRVSDPTSLPRLGVAATLSPVLYGRAEAGAHALLADRWTAGLGYRFEGARIYDERGQAGYAHSPWVDAWFKASRITELGMELRLQQFVFGPETDSAASAAASVRHRFTRQVHVLLRAGAGAFQGAQGLGPRPYPRLHLEVGREGERVDVGLALGHDLMGASGFTAALWADYGSAVVDWRVLEPLKLFGAASVYRNGHAPDLGFWPPDAAGAAQGYTLAAGLEWRVSGALAFKLQGDRYAQIGAAVPGAVNVSLNVLSARVVVTPFDWAPGRGW